MANIEHIAKSLLAVGKELFPRGYVKDVYAWDETGLSFAWVMPPEKLERALNADGNNHLPFGGPRAAYVFGHHGYDEKLFSYEREMGAADFLQRVPSAFPREWVKDADEEWIAIDVTFIPEPGFPWPTKRYYSAARDAWVKTPRRPKWLLPEAIVDEGWHVNSPGVDLCKLVDTPPPPPRGACVARYGPNPNEVFMVTHAMGTWNELTRFGSWKENAAVMNRCGGFLFPSMAVGPVPATNFGPFVVIADVNSVLSALKPYRRSRQPTPAFVYSSDAWTGRASTFLRDAAISAFEQLHGHGRYESYFDLNLWQLGPQADAPLLSGPGVADQLDTVRQLAKALRSRFRIWRRDLSVEQVERTIEKQAMTAAHYAYLEAKVTTIMPLSAFPLAIAPEGYADGFRGFLKATGFKGKLVEVELPDEILHLMQSGRGAAETWANLQYGWHVLDVVREHSATVTL